MNDNGENREMQWNEDFVTSQIRPEEPVKKKKEKKPMSSAGRSAINGIIFGLCGALVFSGVMVVGNKTFLKKDASAKVAEVSGQDDGKTGSRDEEVAKRADNSESAAADENEVGKSVTVPVTSTPETATISEITKQTMPSIVSITVKGVEEVRSMFGTQKYESEGAGSGIIVSENDEDLFIATNNHVVSGANEVSICFDDSKEAVVAATVRGTDAKNDLAIVSVKKSDMDKDVLDNVRVIAIGSSGDLSVGDQVIAIGNALGYGQSVTTGIVSALDRETEIENMAAKLIQTDAAINPGNSGGALLNIKGELVGINSAKFASEEVEGMGYAIPIDTAMPILNKLMNRASREVVSDEEAGFMGITVSDVSSEASKMYGIPEGAYIAEVQKDSGADKAGLIKSDVITEFDGIGISGAKDLTEQIKYYKQGESVEVTYMRMENGEYVEKKTKVTLAASESALKQRNQEKEISEDEEQLPEGSDDAQEFDDQQQMPQLPDRDRDEDDKGNGQERYPDGYDDGGSGYGYGFGDDSEDLQEFFDRFFGQAQEYGYGMAPQGRKGY